jgi:hypothetical protein
MSGPHGQETHGAFVPSGPTHDLGYEPDKFGVKTILAVPAAVIITMVLAFVLTWILFSNIFDPRIQEPPDNPEAARRGNAPLNDRFDRISSTDPKAEFQQPRLEGLQETEVYERDGGVPITSMMMTTKPKKEGNSPRYHAEDLRPEKQPALQGGPAAGVTKVPIGDAINQLVGDGMLRAREGAENLEINADWDRPKESNGGRGKRPEPAKPAAKKEEPKKEEPKKDEPKKDEPKKDPENKGAEPKKE